MSNTVQVTGEKSTAKNPGTGSIRTNAVWYAADHFNTVAEFKNAYLVHSSTSECGRLLWYLWCTHWRTSLVECTLLKPCVEEACLMQVSHTAPLLCLTGILKQMKRDWNVVLSLSCSVVWDECVCLYTHALWRERGRVAIYVHAQV